MSIFRGGIYLPGLFDLLGWGATPNPDGSLGEVQGPTIGVVNGAPAGAASPGSLRIRIDAGNVGLLQEVDGLGTWQGVAGTPTMETGLGTVRVVDGYNILVTDTEPHDIDATGGNVNLNLPAAADWIAANPSVPFVRVGAYNIDNAATVTPDGAETINGAVIYTFTALYESIDLYPVVGVVWRIR